jgi:SAM-dependent methyltransferase
MTQAIDEAKLHEFLGQVVGDLSAYSGAVMGYIGDRLGLYRAIAEAGAVTSSDLAARTGTAERYVRDWLVNQAAGGYIQYDAQSGRYSMAPEQAMALTDESSPAFVAGAFQVMLSVCYALPRILENFRTGGGMAWGEHHPDLFEGTERFFKPTYVGCLLAEWIPALDGVQRKLEAGARVADVGCGHGASTLLMAEAFPSSRFVGFDLHAPSIERARLAAREAGVADRAEFEVAHSADFPGDGYDLVAFFDCLHDMSHPEKAARRAYETLAPDGAVMLVEPMAGARIEDNFNPVGRLFAAASVMVCTPNAVAGGGRGLGTIASDDDLAEVFNSAGFSHFRRAAETPFNRVFEARK